MNAFAVAVLALAGGFLGVAMADLVSEEIRARLDKAPRALLRVAVLRLPASLRGELSDEWSAELAEILSGSEALPVTRLWVGGRFAVGLLFSSRRVGRALGRRPADDLLPPELSGIAYTGLELATVRKAYATAAQWHRNQWRRSGDPHVTHCVAVARILADMGMDATTVCAGLLHDVTADTDFSVTRLQAEFGDEIAAIVGDVVELDSLRSGSVAGVLEATEPRVLAVKLADRLHNMQTIQYMQAEKQRLKSRETLDLFAPLAGRLGLESVKGQLEDLAQATLARRA
jgi:HD domain